MSSAHSSGGSDGHSPAAEQVTGIAGSQKSRQASATARRNAHHGFLKKITSKAIIVLTIIIPLLLWWRSDDVQKEVQSQVSSSKSEQGATPRKLPSEPVVTQGVAAWEKTAENGSLPVGVWSAVTPVGVGCSVKFAFGEGFRVQYRFYSKEWSNYTAGTSPNASELRFMVTKAGITNLPYTVKCS